MEKKTTSHDPVPPHSTSATSPNPKNTPFRIQQRLKGRTPLQQGLIWQTLLAKKY